MKKKIVYITILLVIIILQTSVLPVIMGAGMAIPNMVLMAILAWSILDGFSAFLGWAIFAGIVYDLAAYSPLGVSVLVFVLVVYFVSFFSRRLTVELKGMGILFFAAFVVVATLLSRFVIASAMAWEIQSLRGYWNIFGSAKVVALMVVYNEILFFILFAAIRKMKKFFEIE